MMSTLSSADRPPVSGVNGRAAQKLEEGRSSSSRRPNDLEFLCASECATDVTLLFGSTQDARVPELDGGDAAAVVLDALSCRVPAFPVLIWIVPRLSSAQATKMRIDSVSSIVNTDIVNQY
jgi:hypothetical protein